MNQSVSQNRRWVLASRPHGAPVADNFRLEEQPVPVPAAGEVLLRTIWLSLDPYMRGRMSDAPSYSPPVEIGAVMVGGTVSRVEQSSHPDFKAGEWVWDTAAGRSTTSLTAVVWSNWAKIPPILPGRWAFWECRALPPTWGCWISGNPKRVRPWWLPRQRGP
ncbi:NADP-dependent oxidoreductase yncB [Enterobacter cloacae]|nr:NADP-dependent oxidoreductase yncB [Enterobacter cloacae]